MPPISLHALTFGHKPVNPANHFYGLSPLPQGLETQFYFWCIRDAAQGVILVDQGCSRATVAAMGIAPCLTAEPAELLERLDVRPGDVRHVIVSHLHWDHFGGDDIFPNAVYHVHRRELAHTDGPLMRFPLYAQHYSEAALRAFKRLREAGRVRVMEEDTFTLTDGVECLRMGGHSPGLLSVAVRGPKGEFLICSDVLPRYRNLEDGIPCGIHYDVTEALEALETLGKRAGTAERVLPGHEPLLTARFPEIAPGVHAIFGDMPR